MRNYCNTSSYGFICSIYNEVRYIDTTHIYRDGGLGTCETDSAALKLKEAAKIITDPDHRFYDAKRRFDILLGGQSIDVWAAEVRYYLSCYRRFVYTGNDTLKQILATILLNKYWQRYS